MGEICTHCNDATTANEQLVHCRECDIRLCHYCYVRYHRCGHSDYNHDTNGWEEYLSFDGTMKEKNVIGDYTLYVGLDGRGYYAAVEYKKKMVWSELLAWRHRSADDAKQCAMDRRQEHQQGILVPVGV